MKEPHEKRVAICSAPSFALSAAKCPVKRKQGKRWAGYRASKICNQGADAVTTAEGDMTSSAIASGWPALRSRRTHARLETPCTRTGRPPETFDFLGFTHISGKDRKGSYALKRKTISKRMRSKLMEIKQQLRRRMHEPVAVSAKWLRSIVQGYSTTTQYRATPTVCPHSATGSFRLWRTMLIHRGQKHHLTWARMQKLADRWLPEPRVLHPYPRVRFDAIHPR
jgi:hypothetical protein